MAILKKSSCVLVLACSALALSGVASAASQTHVQRLQRRSMTERLTAVSVHARPGLSSARQNMSGGQNQMSGAVVWVSADQGGGHVGQAITQFFGNAGSIF